MNILRLFNGFADEVELFRLMSEITKEVAPLPVLLTDLYAYDAYEFVTGKRAPRDADFHIDEAGNIWLSSKRKGRNYDVVPASSLDTWLENKAGLGTIVGVIAENRPSANITIVSLPDDDRHKGMIKRHAEDCGGIERFLLCEAPLRLRPERGAIREATLY